MAAAVRRMMTPMSDIAAAMGHLRGSLGNYAVLGNHDWAWSGAQTEEALRCVGIRVLKDEVAQAGALQVVGYEDLSSGRVPDFERLHGAFDRAKPAVALAHSPDTFVFARSGPRLMLAGHAHGGQVRMPGFGPLLLPLEHSRYDRGWFSAADRRLYVTAGLGTSGLPVRFCCPPEVVVLRLVPERANGG